MRVQLGDLVMGGLMLVMGLIGLVMASRALDDAIAIFGWSLAAFAVAFVLGLVRRHFDRIDAHHAAPGGGHV